MQLLIEWMKDVYYPAMYEDAIEKATELLETERQDHERTYVDAFVNSNGTQLKVDFEQYYKDTYQ